MSAGKMRSASTVSLARHLIFAGGVVAGALGSPATLGADRYWDGDGAGVVGGGAGIWDLSLNRWSTAAGGSTYQAWNNAANDTARFGGAAGLVTLDDPITAAGLVFTTSGYEIAGTGTDVLTLSGTGIVDTGAAPNVITISAQVSGAAGLHKRGTGTLILTNTNNNYAGPTRWSAANAINAAAGLGQGTIQLGASNVIPDASDLQLWTNTNVLDMNGFSETVNNVFILGTGVDSNISKVVFTNSQSVLTVNGSITLFGRGRIGGTAANVASGSTIELGGNYIELLGHSRNDNTSTLLDRLELNTDRTPMKIIRPDTGNTVLNLTSAATRLTAAGVVADGVSPAGILKTNNGTLILNAANTYTGGTIIAEGAVDVASASNLGGNVAGNDVRIEGGALNLTSASNLGSNQALTVNSNGYRKGVLGVGFNSLPSFTSATAAVLAINTSGYNAVTDLSALGNGQWFLGSNGTGTLTSASLAPATDNVYRLGGGLNSFAGFTGVMQFSNTLSVANGVLADNGGTQRSLLVGIDNAMNGAITVNLQGNNAYTGATTIDAGTLRLSGANGALSGSQNITVNGVNATFRQLMDYKLELDNSGAAGNNNGNRLHDSATVTMNSGDFRLIGNANAATTEAYGALVLNSGNVKVTIDPGSGRTATLAGNTLTRLNNATAVFRGQNMGAATAVGTAVSNVTFATAPTLSGGALNTTAAGIIPWALVDDVNAGHVFNTDPDPSANNAVTDFGDSFATYGANGIRALLPGEVSAGFTSGDNVRLTTATTPGAGTVSVNSLHIATGGSVSGANATNLVVSSGGILHTNTAATEVTAAQIATVTAGNGTAPAELIIHSPNAVGNGLFTLGSTVQDNAGQKVGLTVSGSNTVFLKSNVNAHTGKTVINGNLWITSIKNVGAGASSVGAPATAADGTIDLAGSLFLHNTAAAGAHTTDRDFRLLGTATIQNDKGTSSLNLNGDITGVDQNLLLSSSGGSATSVNIGATSTINLGAGILSTRGNVSINSSGHAFSTLQAINPSTNITVGVDNALPTGVTVEINRGSTLNLNGFSQTIGNLSDNAGDVTSSILQIDRTVTNGSTSSASTLTVNNAYTNSWGGMISDASAANPLHLTKGNAGELILYGTNSYRGNTTVNGGTLTVMTSLANNGSNKVRIAADSDGDFVNGAPTLARATKLGANLAGWGSTVTSGLQTQADLLAGSNTSGTDAVTTMRWRLRSTDVAVGDLASEILELSDMNNSVGSDQTDPFVLQMNYDQAAVDALGSEAAAIASAGLYLGWLDGGQWVNAIDGNVASNALPAQQNYAGSFASFQTTYGATITNYIGAWGVDPTTNQSWAVLDHNSEFAVAVTVPEPAALGLLVFGSTCLLRRRQRGTADAGEGAGKAATLPRDLRIVCNECTMELY